MNVIAKMSSVALIWLGAASASAEGSLTCTIWDFVDDPEGSVTVKKEMRVLSHETPYFYVSTGLWLDVQTGVDIHFDDETRGLSVRIGDYCGERYHESRHTYERGPVKEWFSYGRNAESFWKRIAVECNEQ